MEQVHGSHKASKFAPEDVISTMPDDVIINILNRLPLQDAVRTSILSKNWKHNWNMITQLVFNEDFYEYLQEKEKEKDYKTIINMFLTHLKGAITKFVLYIQEDNAVDVEDINKWVLFLSQKGIQEFTLKNMDETPLEFPAHLFSCLQLKHLKLFNCHICPESSFHGFPGLLSLCLSEVVFGSYTCGEFIACCPLLEILKLRSNTGGKIKRDEIAKLENLKVLILQLRELEYKAIITSSSIFQLVGYFPKLQELNLNFWKRKLSADAEMSVLTALPYLKTLRLYEIDFSNAVMVSFAIDLICGLPNVETLLIKAGYEDDVPVHVVSSSKVDFSKLKLLQLRKVEIVSVRCTEIEICWMESLLACSPLLKKMVISPESSNVFFADDGEREFAKALKQHRASPVAEIVIDSANRARTSHVYPHVLLN
nr:hypothetical protein [Tanacetum cinerariifolium]